jgi:hypothetical protein
MHRERQGPLGRFIAESVSPKGIYLRTFHHDEDKAYRRLIGNPRHNMRSVFDRGEDAK